MDVRAMCAIGRRGQLGLQGRLPWEGATGAEYRADVERFWEMTRGHVLLAGPATLRSIPAFAHADRTIVELRSGAGPGGHARPLSRPHRLYRRRAAGLGRLCPANPALGHHPPAL